MGLRGPTPKSATYHKLNGTYRPSRHGPLPERTQRGRTGSTQARARGAAYPALRGERPA